MDEAERYYVASVENVKYNNMQYQNCKQVFNYTLQDHMHVSSSDNAKVAYAIFPVISYYAFSELQII